MKSKILKTLIVLPALLIVATIINCGGHSTPPPTGFNAQGQQWVLAPDGSFFFLTYGPVQGSWQFDYSGATGNTRFFSMFAQGFGHVNDGRAPARWLIFVPLPCLTYLDPPLRDVTVNSNQLSRCVVSPIFLAADPASVDLQSPPATVTISGGGFSTDYGMPLVEYYDQYSGELVASSTASSVASDGSSIQVATPSLYGVYTGSYNIVVSNVAADGSPSMVGIATFSACCVDPPPPPPPPDPGDCGQERVCEIY